MLSTSELPRLEPTRIVSEESRRRAEEELIRLDDIAHAVEQETRVAAAHGLSLEEYEDDFLADLRRDAADLPFQS